MKKVIFTQTENKTVNIRDVKETKIYAFKSGSDNSISVVSRTDDDVFMIIPLDCTYDRYVKAHESIDKAIRFMKSRNRGRDEVYEFDTTAEFFTWALEQVS